MFFRCQRCKFRTRLYLLSCPEWFFGNEFATDSLCLVNVVARILLSWFPGLQSSRFVRPVITVCDPYLNLFRNVLPPIFGLDLSPVLALFLLQALGSVRPYQNILSSIAAISFFYLREICHIYSTNSDAIFHCLGISINIAVVTDSGDGFSRG